MSDSSSVSSNNNSSNNISSSNLKMTDVDTKTLPRIGGSRKDADVWKYRIERWFKREGIVTDDDKFGYIISAAEDDLVRAIQIKEIELKRTPTLDECVEVIKKQYWRENQKDDKLRLFKRMAIEPGETVYEFNTEYLKLYRSLENEDRASVSVIDYENALRFRPQIYERIAMAEYDSLEEACRQAEKYENILMESNHNRNINRRNGRMNNYNSYHNNSHYTTNNYNNSWEGNVSRNRRQNGNNYFDRMPNNIPSYSGNVNNNLRNVNHNSPINNNYNTKQNNINDSVDDLVNKMENLHIKTCFFCNQPGHFIKDCENLRRIQNDPNIIKYLNSQKN